MISQISAGKMTALALVDDIRTPLLPNVRTLEDLSYKGAPARTWYGLFAPSRAEPVIDKITAEVTRVVSDASCSDKYVVAAASAAIDAPEQFAAEIKADRAAAKDVVKASGLEPQ